MKKRFSLIAIALVLTLAIGTAAAAATPTPEQKDIVVNTKNGNTVVGIYSQKVTWDSLTFTYDFAATTNTWDAENHVYTTSGSVSGWDKTSATIKVQNDSNKPITVTFSIDTTKKNNVSTSLSKTSFTLASAEGTDKDAGPEDSTVLTISGIPNTTTGFNHSKVTLTISH